METVQSLREKGFKVQVRYERMRCGVEWKRARPVRFWRQPYSPHRGFLRPLVNGEVQLEGKDGLWPRGGRTDVTVTTPQGTQLHAVADCSLADNFDRKRGLQIALGRALKHFEAGAPC